MWPPLFPSPASTLLGIEFTRASQVATGVLFHSSMTTSQSWWMLETLRSSTFHLRMPHRLPIPSASLASQWSSWRYVWGRYHVGIYIIIQGWATSVLECRCPVEFISNPNQTHLNKLIKIFRIFRATGRGFFSGLELNSLQDIGTPGSNAVYPCYYIWTIYIYIYILYI